MCVWCKPRAPGPAPEPSNGHQMQEMAPLTPPRRPFMHLMHGASPSVARLGRPVVSCGPPAGDQSLVGHRAEIAQLVEHATENRGVASSILALGTTIRWWRSYRAEVAQLVEHHLAKVRVAGSSPVFRSISLSDSRPSLERSRRCPFV